MLRPLYWPNGTMSLALRLRCGRLVQVNTAAREMSDLQARLAIYQESASLAPASAAAALTTVIVDTAAQIEACRARMGQVSGLPQVVLVTAGPDADETWEAHQEAGDILWCRQVVRALVRVVVHRSTQRRGVRGFDRASIEIIDR